MAPWLSFHTHTFDTQAISVIYWVSFCRCYFSAWFKIVLHTSPFSLDSQLVFAVPVYHIHYLSRVMFPSESSCHVFSIFQFSTLRRYITECTGIKHELLFSSEAHEGCRDFCLRHGDCCLVSKRPWWVMLGLLHMWLGECEFGGKNAGRNEHMKEQTNKSSIYQRIIERAHERINELPTWYVLNCTTTVRM